MDDTGSRDVVSDFDGIADPATAKAMQAVYDRIRELGGDPWMIALADRVAARARDEEER